MCCRRGPRRTPLTIVLATAAYNAYKSHKEKKRLEAGQREAQQYEDSYTSRAVPEQSLTEAMHGMKLAESGIAPPHYYDVVQVDRAEMPVNEPTYRVHTKEAKAYEEEDDRESLSDAGSLLAGGDFTMRACGAGYNDVLAKDRRCGERCAGRCEDRRRAREAWREEKAARRAVRIAEKQERRAGRYGS